jgi:hypothetical protein
MSISTQTLKCWRGTDPDEGDRVVVFGLHNADTDALEACVCMDDPIDNPCQLADSPDLFKLYWSMEAFRLGHPQQIALDFLKRDDTVLLWSEKVETQHVQADGTPFEDDTPAPGATIH